MISKRLPTNLATSINKKIKKLEKDNRSLIRTVNSLTGAVKQLIAAAPQPEVGKQKTEELDTKHNIYIGLQRLTRANSRRPVDNHRRKDESDSEPDELGFRGKNSFTKIINRPPDKCSKVYKILMAILAKQKDKTLTPQHIQIAMQKWVTRHYRESNKTKFLEKKTIRAGYQKLIEFLKIQTYTTEQIGNNTVHQYFAFKFANHCASINPLPHVEKEFYMHTARFIKKVLTLVEAIKIPQIDPRAFNHFPDIFNWTPLQESAAITLFNILSFLRNTEMNYTSVTQLGTLFATKELIIIVDNKETKIIAHVMYCKVPVHKTSNLGIHKFTCIVMAILDPNNVWKRTIYGKAICLLVKMGRSRSANQRITWDPIIPPHFNAHSKQLESLSRYHFNKAIKEIYKATGENHQRTSYTNRRTIFGILIALNADTDLIKECATWSEPKRMLNYYVGQASIALVDQYRDFKFEHKVLFLAQAQAYSIYTNVSVDLKTHRLPERFYEQEPDQEADSDIGEFEFEFGDV